LVDVAEDAGGAGVDDAAEGWPRPETAGNSVGEAGGADVDEAAGNGAWLVTMAAISTPAVDGELVFKDERPALRVDRADCVGLTAAAASPDVGGGAVPLGDAVELDTDRSGRLSASGAGEVDPVTADDCSLCTMSAKGEAAPEDAMTPPKPTAAAPGAAAFSMVEAADEICIDGDQRTRKAAQRSPVLSNSRANVVNVFKPMISLT
jgi:hypothetical protein